MKFIFGIGMTVTYVAMGVGYFVIVDSIISAVKSRKNVPPDNAQKQ